MVSRTVRIIHRPQTVWEQDQAAQGLRTHRIVAYREILRVVLKPHRPRLAAPPAALAAQHLRGSVPLA